MERKRKDGRKKRREKQGRRRKTGGPKEKTTKKAVSAEKEKIRLQNKGGKPDNVVLKEMQIEDECARLQSELPSFMRGFFAYMRQSLLSMSRLAYLHDIRFFCRVSHRSHRSHRSLGDQKDQSFGIRRHQRRGHQYFHRLLPQIPCGKRGRRDSGL